MYRRLSVPLLISDSGITCAGVDGRIPNPILAKPGYKLLEMADWDYNSSVFLLDTFIAEVPIPLHTALHCAW